MSVSKISRVDACAVCFTEFGTEDTEYGFSVERFRPIHAKLVEYWPLKKQVVAPVQFLNELENEGKRVYVCYLCHVTVQRIEEFQTLVRQSESLMKAAVEERWKGFPQQDNEIIEEIDEGQVVPYDPSVVVPHQDRQMNSSLISQIEQGDSCYAVTSPLTQSQPCCSKTVTKSKPKRAKNKRGSQAFSSAEGCNESQTCGSDKDKALAGGGMGYSQLYPTFGPDEMILSQPSMRLAAAKSISLCRAQIAQLNSRSFIDDSSPVKKGRPRLSPVYKSTSSAAHSSRIRQSAKKITAAAKRHATRQSALCTKRPRKAHRMGSPRKSSLSKILVNGPAVNCTLCDVKFCLDSTGDKRQMEKSWKLAQEGLVVHFGSAHNPVRRNVDIVEDEDGKEYYACTACSFKAFVDTLSSQPQRNLRINAHVKLSRHFLRAHGTQLPSLVRQSTPRRSVKPRPVNLFGSPSSPSASKSLLPSFLGSWRQCPHPECTFQASLPGEGQALLKPGNYRRVELKLARHYLRTHEFPTKFKVSGKHPCVKRSTTGPQLCFACPRCPYEKQFDSNNRGERTSRDTALSLFLRHFYRNHVYNNVSNTQAYSDVSSPEPSQSEQVNVNKRPETHTKSSLLSSGSKSPETTICTLSLDQRRSESDYPAVTLLCPENIVESGVFEFEVEFRGPVDVKPFKDEVMMIDEIVTP